MEGIKRFDTYLAQRHKRLNILDSCRGTRDIKSLVLDKTRHAKKENGLASFFIKVNMGKN